MVSVFAIWLEQFPADFDDSPKYTCLNRMLSFVTSEMKPSYHRDELARKIKHKLDKFRITPFEDQGKALCQCCWLSVKVFCGFSFGKVTPFMAKVV